VSPRLRRLSPERAAQGFALLDAALLGEQALFGAGKDLLPAQPVGRHENDVGRLARRRRGGEDRGRGEQDEGDHLLTVTHDGRGRRIPWPVLSCFIYAEGRIYPRLSLPAHLLIDA